MIRTIHRAKFILAEADLLLQNAAVHVSDPGRISRLEPWHGPPSKLEIEVMDWGEALILPGLVNAHTHLELTDLRGQISKFSSFTDWVTQLVQKRRMWAPEQFAESTSRGARESLAFGTTLVGDISNSGESFPALAREKLRAVVFEEVLAFQPERVREVFTRLVERLGQREGNDLLTLGVSPHAPYSVAPELYRKVLEISRAKGFPLATHTAETRGELEFLETGTGEFQELLQRTTGLPEGWKAPCLPSVKYLEGLGILCQPTLLIHCNYLDRDSMQTILRTQSSVVFCPRSHAFFGHERHPVRELLDLGANVALGTDSLASNENLSVLDEMRFLFKHRKDLRSEEIIRMATLNGSGALGYGGMLGRLRRGYWADMTILELPENTSPRNLVSQILEGAGSCLGTIVKGELAWRRR